MWFCSKCNSVQEDAYSNCTNCGAPRGAGRFASAPAFKPAPAYTQPVEAPAPVAPRSVPVSEPAPKPAPKPAPRPAPQATYIPNLDKVHAGGGMRFLGIVLSLLLPLLTGVIAFFKYDEFQPLLTGLFFEAPETQAKAVLVGIYAVFALAAVLLSALPGLWTLSIGKMLRRFARMEELL